MLGWTQNESIIGFPHLSRFRTSPTSLDVVPRIHQRCLGSSHTKTPKKWEQRYLIIPQGKLERVLIICIVVVAMSGGVDSSVAAKLLAEKVRHVDNPFTCFCSQLFKDYDLSAIFMRNWDTRDESGTDVGCDWEKDWEDVQRVCGKLDIPCQMVRESHRFDPLALTPRRTFRSTCQESIGSEYLSLPSGHGRRATHPIPMSGAMGMHCLVTHRHATHTRYSSEIKFGALIKHLPEGTDFLATGQSLNQLTSFLRLIYSPSGHYARKTHHPQNYRSQLTRPSDLSKDQTYYLSSISESGLDMALFPLADVPKTQVREIARAAGLHNASREESMGLCFVGERRRFNDFLGMS